MIHNKHYTIRTTGRNGADCMMETYIFKESDWICEVELLENLSDDSSTRFKLKVVKHISVHPCFESLPPVGSVFICSKRFEEKESKWDLIKTNKEF